MVPSGGRIMSIDNIQQALIVVFTFTWVIAIGVAWYWTVAA